MGAEGMTTVYLRKTISGLVPDREEDAELIRRFKVGSVVKAEITHPRNLRFFRKWFALVKVAFGLWEETGIHATHKGQTILPNFEKFRKDVTILAGHCHPVINVNGELRLEADSISFSHMDEETFERLYSATLTAIVHRVMRGRISEERLREMAERVEEFA